jgi:TolB protein
MNADGSNLTNLTNHPANDFRPDWSADGTRLVFVSDRGEGENIYILELSSGNVLTVTTGVFVDGLPKWSADGQTILFASNRGGLKGLFTVSADGKNAPQPVLPWPQRDDSPAWADGGRFILFSSQRTGDWELYALRRGDGKIYQYGSAPGFDRFPTWKP